MSTQDRKLGRLVSIDSVVHNVLNDLGDYDKVYFLRYKQWAIRGMKKLGLHVLNIRETDYFTVDSNNLVNLPDDFIDYIRVGVVLDGRIWTLTQNENIPLTREWEGGQPVQYTDIQDTEPLPEIGTWLAAPPKVYNLAFFRYDKEYNRMVFSGDMAGESVLIEYISTGVSKNGVTYVPVQAEEAVIAWVHYQRVLNDPKSTIGERQLREYIWKGTVADLSDFEFSLSYDDILDILSAGYTQGAKR